MRLNNPRKLWLTALFLVSTTTLLLFRQYWQENYFSCQGKLVIAKDSYWYEGLIHFTFARDKGTYDSKGLYRVGNSEVVRREESVPFEYWKEGESRVLVSGVDSALSAKSAETLAIPDFFRLHGRGFVIRVRPLNSAAVLITENNIPILVCQKTR